MPKSATMKSKAKVQVQAPQRPLPQALEPRPKAEVQKPQETAKVASGPPDLSRLPTQPVQPTAAAPKPSLFELGAGYRIKVKPGSGYQAFYDVMAQKGHFGECAAILAAPGFDPSQQAAAGNLMTKLLVSREVVEQEMLRHPVWVEHCQKKTKQLKERAKKGIHAAKKIVGESDRFVGGLWKGKVAEIISVCCGSYTARNRNSNKYREAGIVVRPYPIEGARASQGQFLMMFPAKFGDAVRKCIKTQYGVDEKAPDLGSKK